MSSHPTSNLRLFLFATPRTRSNLLIQLLGSHPLIKDQQYPFTNAYHFGPERQFSRDIELDSTGPGGGRLEDFAGETYQAALDEFQKFVKGAESESKVPLTKDHIFYLMDARTVYKLLGQKDTSKRPLPVVTDRALDVQEDPSVATTAKPEEHRPYSNPTLIPDRFLLTFTPILIIRHPARAYPSSLRAHSRSVGGSVFDANFPSNATYKLSRMIYDWYNASCDAQSLPASRRPIIVDGDKLVRDTPHQMKTLCGAVGLDASQIRYNWEPKGDHGWGKVWDAYYEGIKNSTGVIKTEDALEAPNLHVELEKWKKEWDEDIAKKLMEFVELSLDDYNYLLERIIELTLDPLLTVTTMSFPPEAKDPRSQETSMTDLNVNAGQPDEKKLVLLEDMFEDGAVDPVYQAKARVLNAAIQEIGCGRYQYYLFCCAGFGWFADSVWPLITGLILSPVIAEFHFNGPFLSLAANIGLLVGAMFWSIGCDIWGRRWSFNLTLLIAGVFGLAAGGSPDFITLASLVAVLGIGVGGNMPVDSAVFLDLVPASHQYLLTVMSVWWSLGQLVVSLLAWPLIANFSCPTNATTCNRSENMGWRYLLFTLGGLTLLLWGLRFFVFKLFESPRFLVGIGKDAEAVEVIHQVAKYNNKISSLTVEQLENAGRVDLGQTHKSKVEGERKVLSKTSVFGLDHIKALFRTKKLAFTTSLLISLWGIIGLASTLYNSFLPYVLATRGASFGDGSLYITYRNQFILSVIGVPGAFLAGWAVELPFIGRKGTLAITSGEW
ncbi:hypothetical protein VNI00_007009 [Paramarasmius palmivorus]|uniref:Major facilitator superfamily (MFS) profile domain-containing protein n=1 Tax=Paramarasmius palmivorus TaxID=297713 RepID=A0AAW0D424_9AGAR